MKIILFLVIAAACILSAVSCKSSSATTGSCTGEFIPYCPDIRSETYLDYVANGISPIDQRRYRFNICKAGDGYRAYIERSPSYRNRQTDGHSTHRHYDGRYYVCWTDPVKTYDGMAAIAKQWAECTQRYIEYGKRF